MSDSNTKLYTFTVGGKEVRVTATRVRGGVDFEAICEGKVKNGRSAPAGKHDATREQVETALEQYAHRLAEQAAGLKVTNSHLDDIFTESGS